MLISLFFKTPAPANIKSKTKILKTVAEETLKSIRSKNLETSIIFVNNAEIKKINKKFLKRTYATDVIAFNYIQPNSHQTHSRVGDLAKSQTPIRESEPIPFGDVFVCMDQAKKQADLLKHSLIQELAILTVHGCLHLKGMEDGTKAEKTEMDKKTELYIKKYFP